MTNKETKETKTDIGIIKVNERRPGDAKPGEAKDARQLADRAQEIERAVVSFDELRVSIQRIDALAVAARDLYDNTTWGPDVERRRIDHVAHLVGAVAEASEQALVACDKFNADLCDANVPGWGDS